MQREREMNINQTGVDKNSIYHLLMLDKWIGYKENK